MSEHLDVWVKARAAIADGSNWCCGTAALTRDGLHTDPEDTEAAAFCMGGAMIVAAAGSHDRASEAWCALADTCGVSRQGFPGHFNDTHSHGEVLALLDKGIASARASRTLPSLLDIPASPTRVNETV